MIEATIAIWLALAVAFVLWWRRSSPVESIDDRLARLSRAHPELNYKESVVDLMKLLGMDSSLENRKRLAREFGWTGEFSSGSAEMNLFLMREIRRRPFRPAP